MHREVDGVHGVKPARARRGVEDRCGMADLLEKTLRMELLLASRYRKAIECACDARQAASWRQSLDAACARIAALLACLPADPDRLELDEGSEGDCLIEAMELARRNGDRIAAQAVARECILLAEGQCSGARNGYDAASCGSATGLSRASSPACADTTAR